MIVEKIIGDARDFQGEDLKIDKVYLDDLGMGKPHQKLTAESGEKIAISLDHGEHLFCGAVLYKDSERMIVVDMLPEDVLEIRPEGNRQWAKTAFNIGNMHHPAYLYDDCIRIPYDGILENLMKSIGVAYTRCERKLDGEKAAQTVGNHQHHHHHHHHNEE